MKATSRVTAPYRHYAILDDDFDGIDEFEAMVLSSIERCGTIDIHPNDWGRHDSVGVNTDNMHYMPDYFLPETKAKSQPAKSQPVNKKERKARWDREFEREKIRFEERKTAEQQRLQLRNLLMEQISKFPHATGSIAFYTAEEFCQFGKADAVRRGISNEDWIWKRSRFLAGFK